jgi:hypothetical protein
MKLNVLIDTCSSPLFGWDNQGTMVKEAVVTAQLC